MSKTLKRIAIEFAIGACCVLAAGIVAHLLGAGENLPDIIYGATLCAGGRAGLEIAP